jgi:hypothetical protein
MLYKDDHMTTCETKEIDYSEHKYGTIIYNGKKLILLQDAYPIEVNNGPESVLGYTATAEDEEGNEYTVTWTAYDHWNLKEGDEGYDEFDFEDESNACDWCDYKVEEN